MGTHVGALGLTAGRVLVRAHAAPATTRSASAPARSTRSPASRAAIDARDRRAADGGRERRASDRRPPVELRRGAADRGDRLRRSTGVRAAAQQESSLRPLARARRTSRTDTITTARPRHDHDKHRRPSPKAGTLDFNMRAAYIHILADAMTSVLAIVALALGMWAGLWYLDPRWACVGGVVIIWWAIGLCRQASGQLLDVVSSPRARGRRAPASSRRIDDVRVADLHVWELGPGRRSCIVSIVTSSPRDVDFYREHRPRRAADRAPDDRDPPLRASRMWDNVENEAQVAHRHEH